MSSQYYHPELNLTINWVNDRKQEQPNNHYFWQLVFDCIAELKTTDHVICFNQEQVNEIVKRSKYKLKIEYTRENIMLWKIKKG